MSRVFIATKGDQMTTEIPFEDPQAFDGSVGASLARAPDVMSKQPAPTTHRRVGRSMIKPPGPAVDDGPSDSTISTEETPEDLGSAIIESAQQVLKTRRGRDALHTALDGLHPDERNVHETERLDRTTAQMTAENTLVAFVFVVPDSVAVTLRFANGEKVPAHLVPPQRSAWYSRNRNHAIVVAWGLIQDEIIDEAVKMLAAEIESVAVENDVVVRRGGTLRFLRSLVVRFFLQNPAHRRI
jgi:hypothetical protein